MGKKDPRIDACIAKSAEFARPVLVQLRGVIHAACPEVEETIKWGVPHYMHHGILCGTAAFKAHLAFIVWNKPLASSLKEISITKKAMAKLYRITNVAELPKTSVLKKLVKKAAELNAAGVKRLARKPKKRTKLVVPTDLKAALAKNKKAKATFDDFSYTSKKEYIVWITGAKQAKTRAKRLATAIERLAEGKRRHWKYENC